MKYLAMALSALIVLAGSVLYLSGGPSSHEAVSPPPVKTRPITPEIAQQAAVQIFLVRHAEKTADKNDPALTAAGTARAETLAVMLKDADITHIHSSDYTRTRDTAAPLAKRLGLTVELYDPRDLPAMAERLKSQSGRHLVVGHSNTTPQLTEQLGGDGGTPIVEATEYNRLYYVVIGADGRVDTALLRFGEGGRPSR
jgi:phosphohistidine phosphatase SixA